MTTYEIDIIQRVLREARTIATLDRTADIKNSGDGYAHALGRANGIAKGAIIPWLEALIEGATL